MIITDTKLASFKQMIKNFADRNDIRYEIRTTTNKNVSEVELGTIYKYERYVVEWDKAPNLSEAAARIFADAIHKFKLTDNVTSAFKDPAFEIKNVIFNDPATVVLWEDGTKTVVKCQDGDIYNKETGLALCIAKKALGNQSNFNNVFKKWVPEEKNLHDSVTFTIDNITLDDPYSDKFNLDNVIEKCNEKFRKLFGGENV